MNQEEFESFCFELEKLKQSVKHNFVNSNAMICTGILHFGKHLTVALDCPNCFPEHWKHRKVKVSVELIE